MKEKLRILIGILLAPLLVFGMIVTVNGSVERVEIQREEDYYDDYDDYYDDDSGELTLKEQGYVRYRTLPESVNALVNSGVLLSYDDYDDEVYDEYEDESDEPDEDDTDENDSDEDEDDENEADEDDADEDDADEDESDYDDDEPTCLELVEEMDKESVGEMAEPFSTYCDVGFAVQLTFDEKTFSFTNQDVIAKIEECGYTGFSEQLQTIAASFRNTGNESEDYVSGMGTYEISCQGGTFTLFETYRDKFELDFEPNLLDCWIPEKYQDLVERVNETGDYYLISASMGSDTETLTFCKNNSIAAKYTEKTDEAMNNKRLVLAFRNGQLSDYYVVTAGGEYKADEADKNMLDLCTKGLGKSLPEKATMTSTMEGILLIYRAQ